MGYAGILTSDMFGLRTTLDAPTENLIRRRIELKEKSELSDDDRQELSVIETDLEALGFSSTHWDTDYREYLQLRKEAEAGLFDTSEDDPGIQRKRREVAARIVSEMVGRGELEGSREAD
jgi:hypothetical protein